MSVHCSPARPTGRFLAQQLRHTCETIDKVCLEGALFSTQEHLHISYNPNDVNGCRVSCTLMSGSSGSVLTMRPCMIFIYKLRRIFQHRQNPTTRTKQLGATVICEPETAVCFVVNTDSKLALHTRYTLLCSPIFFTNKSQQQPHCFDFPAIVSRYSTSSYRRTCNCCSQPTMMNAVLRRAPTCQVGDACRSSVQTASFLTSFPLAGYIVIFGYNVRRMREPA